MGEMVSSLVSTPFDGKIENSNWAGVVSSQKVLDGFLWLKPKEHQCRLKGFLSL